MGNIKSRYTLAEAAEYLKRETGTPELSVHDLVALAVEGKLSLCFPYKGKLGLFKNEQEDAQTPTELAQSIFGRALKTVYFNGILRSLSPPALDNEITGLRGRPRKEHTLHPVRVMPIGVFASDPPVELGEPEGHHWCRVEGSRGAWADRRLTASIQEAEWMVEAENLHRLVDARAGSGSAQKMRPQREPVTSHSPTTSKPREPDRHVISTKVRRDTLTPGIEQAQQQSNSAWDVAEVWVVLSAMAEKRVAPFIGATEDGIQWLKNGEAANFTRKALAERLRRKKPR